MEPEADIKQVRWLLPAKLSELNLRSSDAHEIIAAYLQDGPGMPLPGYVFSPSGRLKGFYA